jgi:hypothetical protein
MNSLQIDQIKNIFINYNDQYEINIIPPMSCLFIVFYSYRYSL